MAIKKEHIIQWYDEWDNYTEKQLVNALSLLEESYDNLSEILNKNPTDFQKWQASERREEISELYDELYTKLSQTHHQLTLKGIDLGVSHTLESMAALTENPAYISESFIVSLRPSVNITSVLQSSKHLDEYMSGQIAKSKVLTQNLTDEAFETMHRQIQLGIIEGQGKQQILTNAMKTLNTDKKLLREAVKRHVNHTTSVVYNKSKTQTFTALAMKDPDLYYQWFSEIDNSTTIICKALHGQVVKAGQTFKALGWEGSEPPAIKPWHHCRSTHIPWKPDFPSIGITAYSPYPEVQEVIDKAA